MQVTIKVVGKVEAMRQEQTEIQYVLHCQIFLNGENISPNGVSAVVTNEETWRQVNLGDEISFAEVARIG